MQFLNSHRHIMLTFIVLIISTLLYQSARDESAIDSHPYLYLIAISCFTICFGFLYINFTNLNIILLQIMAAVVVISFIVFTVVAYVDASIYAPAIYYIFSILSSILGIGALIISLAIVYKIFVQYLTKLGGHWRIFVSIIFFLPCLLNALIEYILSEYRSTTNEIIVLLILEIVVVIVYFLLNSIKGSEDPRKKKIISQVMFLDRKEKIKVSGMLLREKEEEVKTDNSEQRVENRRYSISMWININTNASNHYSAPIVSYGYKDNYKPLVAYEFDDMSQQNAFAFQFSKTIPATKIYLPPQKWHSIIIVYDGNSATLFCNGAIARKVDLKDNMPDFDFSDCIEVGSDKILNGAITKVNYYTYELSSTDVISMYHLGI